AARGSGRRSALPRALGRALDRPVGAARAGASGLRRAFGLGSPHSISRGGAMRKSVVLAAAAVAVLAVAGSAGATRHAGTFKYCSDPTFPPMELATASGKITGFDVDMAQKLSLTWGANAVAVKTAFPGLIPALNAKKCDAVISGIFITPDRLKQAGAVAYMHSH